jgi:hypothetical protein
MDRTKSSHHEKTYPNKTKTKKSQSIPLDMHTSPSFQPKTYTSKKHGLNIGGHNENTKGVKNT